MLLYCLCYAATLPLATAMISRHVAAAGVKEAYVYMWAPIAWALVGYVLTGWRQWSKAEGDGSDCLKLAAGLSVIMGVFCVLLPPTPPQATGTPILDALSLLGQPNFLLFAIVSMVVAGMMQFYFLGSAPFMQDIGISTKNISAAMAVAQVVQTVATLLLLDSMYKGQIGPAWTMVIGAACWFLLYAAYVWSRKPWLIIPAQSLHGLAYVFFINSGWMFVSNVAYDEIQGSAYGLIWLATNGIGLLLGTNLASIVMDRFRVAGKFQWSRVFAVPLAVTLTGAIVLAIFLHNPVKVDPVKSKPPAATAAVATEK
jgi:hypothetical protein